MGALGDFGKKKPELPIAPPLPPPPEVDTAGLARAANKAEQSRRGRNSLIIDPAMPPGGSGNGGIPDLTL